MLCDAGSIGERTRWRRTRKVVYLSGSVRRPGLPVACPLWVSFLCAKGSHWSFTRRLPMRLRGLEAHRGCGSPRGDAKNSAGVCFSLFYIGALQNIKLGPPLSIPIQTGYGIAEPPSFKRYISTLEHTEPPPPHQPKDFNVGSILDYSARISPSMLVLTRRRPET